MRKTNCSFILIYILGLFGCNASRTDVKISHLPLSDSLKLSIVNQFKEMASLDQQNRSFLDIGTLDEGLIDSVKTLSKLDQIRFSSTYPSTLSSNQIDSLERQQIEIDLENTSKLVEIIKAYGWISKTKLDSVFDPMQFLFHTPRLTIEPITKLLFQEVTYGRMPPISYATYVDNMRKKAFGKNQLYGTGDEFDAESRTIVPPYIENIEETNQARIAIGLPKLKEGEFRLSK